MSVNVRDIAKNCGVSLATVSRVLNNNAKVKDTTRQKVLDTMRSLNYDPLANVPAVKKRSIEATGLVVSIHNLETAGDYYSRVINSFTTHMDKVDGRSLLLTRDKFCKAILEDRINPRTTLGVDRLILAGMDHPEIDTIYDRLEKWDIPFVIMRRETERPGIPMIYNNDREGMKKILRHLRDLGHTRAAFFNAGAPYITDRIRVFREFCAGHDWLQDDNLVYIHNSLYEKGREWVDSVLSEHKVTAIICSADEIATAIIKMARKKGLRVPEDLSVVSFNGGPLVELYDPSITSLKIPVAKMVELGLMMLNQHETWDKNEVNRVELPLELTVRESTGICNNK